MTLDEDEILVETDSTKECRVCHRLIEDNQAVKRGCMYRHMDDKCRFNQKRKKSKPRLSVRAEGFRKGKKRRRTGSHGHAGGDGYKEIT